MFYNLLKISDLTSDLRIFKINLRFYAKIQSSNYTPIKVSLALNFKTPREAYND